MVQLQHHVPKSSLTLVYLNQSLLCSEERNNVVLDMRKTNQCHTLGSGGDSGGVADGSVHQGFAAGPCPGSSRSYKNTAGLSFI